MKISIVGAGNVGSALAERVLACGLADVILVDIAGDVARAKALDLSDAGPLAGYKSRIVGTDSYKETRDSRVIVITAGFPRRPGMSRDDLINKNGEIIKSVLENVKTFSPGSILIVVTNPLDIMTYQAYGEAGSPRNKILGMAGNLDTARFKFLLSEEFKVAPGKIDTFVLGSHGDTMVPLISKTVIDGKPLEGLADRGRIKGLVERTKKRGGEIVGLLKSGSAYFSPSAAVLEILKAIVNDEKKTIICSCIMEGEYGISGCAIGVPARLGRQGITEILEWVLPDDELAALKKSADAVKKTLSTVIARRAAGPTKQSH
jgi:malate dehydrogenase